ncbi:APH(3') family aminoglycoside O-phosphotransferase [Deinococcus alpinitundrae]|uniref:APH(3') family aminoglycoside O-phosphotransferase n=1 Tax=Deinococcus alpinitundrae TaxID=468913 RepID=UPI001ED8CC3F|nr:APH(3') family aminoglycoside O-phosphotransferase [Deinococcus alpinitundrae]
MSLNLPPELRRVLPAARWEDVSGESGATTWQSRNYFVKVQPRGLPESLRTEQAKLRWLVGRVPVPRVVGYAADEASEYLATTRLPGVPMHHPDALLHARRNAELLARALRELHALPIRDCPFNASLAVKLRQARERVEGGLVDEADFDAERLGQSADQVLRQLLKTRPAAEDLVVTHGDACLPNILVSGEYVEGFVDVGRLGIADRHQDLALACRSLRRNEDEDLAEHFLNTYGPALIDPAKLAYYQALDELF